MANGEHRASIGEVYKKTADYCEMLYLSMKKHEKIEQPKPELNIPDHYSPVVPSKNSASHHEETEFIEDRSKLHFSDDRSSPRGLFEPFDVTPDKPKATPKKDPKTPDKVWHTQLCPHLAGDMSDLDKQEVLCYSMHFLSNPGQPFGPDQTISVDYVMPYLMKHIKTLRKAEQW